MTCATQFKNGAVPHWKVKPLGVISIVLARKIQQAFILMYIVIFIYNHKVFPCATQFNNGAVPHWKVKPSGVISIVLARKIQQAFILIYIVIFITVFREQS